MGRGCFPIVKHFLLWLSISLGITKKELWLNDNLLNNKIPMNTLKNNIELSVFLAIEGSLLSCKHTFFWKRIFMPGWILSYWPVVLLVAWSRLTWSGIALLSIPWALGSSYLYFVYGKIMKVAIYDSRFVISDYRKEIKIKLSDIESVGGSILLNPELVWLNLKENSQFGKKIIFMPEPRNFFSISAGLTKHPLVAKLKSLYVLDEEL